MMLESRSMRTSTRNARVRLVNLYPTCSAAIHPQLCESATLPSHALFVWLLTSTMASISVLIQTVSWTHTTLSARVLFSLSLSFSHSSSTISCSTGILSLLKFSALHSNFFFNVGSILDLILVANFPERSRKKDRSKPFSTEKLPCGLNTNYHSLTALLL